MAQEGIISLRCFPSKTDVTVSLIVPVRSAGQFVRLQNSPPFSLSRTNRKASRNFPFRTRFEKRSMTFLRSLIPAKFSEVPHGEVIRVFHELVKPSMIPLVESKQNTLSNLRVIFNALCLSEDNVLKTITLSAFHFPELTPSSSTYTGFPKGCQRRSEER